MSVTEKSPLIGQKILALFTFAADGDIVAIRRKQSTSFPGPYASLRRDIIVLFRSGSCGTVESFVNGDSDKR